jgi:hypothetical protein
MINVDSWFEVEPHTPIRHEVNIIDNNVEIQLGPRRGRTPLVHLMLPDPETCKELALVAAQAGRDFAAELHARDTLEDMPDQDTTSSST